MCIYTKTKCRKCNHRRRRFACIEKTTIYIRFFVQVTEQQKQRGIMVSQLLFGMLQHEKTIQSAQHQDHQELTDIEKEALAFL